MRKYLVILLVFFALVNPVTAATNPKDPYERFNRLIFAFNEVVDNGILQPLAKLYNKIIPKPLNKGIGNFYNNIDTIPTVLNDVLQGNIYQATNDAWRLAINSTVGILGFFDVGAEIGLEPNNTQDFGLTMAQWGYKNSNYLVLPFLGPTTIRDGIGFLINYQYLTIYPYIYPVNERYRLYLLGVVERRANLLHFQGVMDEAALDKYVFMRDAFMQRRNYLIERNKELGDPYMNKNQEKTSEMTDDADGST